MQKSIFILIAVSLILFVSAASSEDKGNLQIKKQPEIQQIKPKKPVKIHLKRSAEGKYSWELTGDDVDEVISVDKRLKKLLKVELKNGG